MWSPNINHSGSCHTATIAEELDSIQGVPKGSLLNTHPAVFWKIALGNKDTKSLYMFSSKKGQLEITPLFSLFFTEEKIYNYSLGPFPPFPWCFLALKALKCLLSCIQSLILQFIYENNRSFKSMLNKNEYVSGRPSSCKVSRIKMNLMTSNLYPKLQSHISSSLETISTWMFHRYFKLPISKTKCFAFALNHLFFLLFSFQSRALPRPHHSGQKWSHPRFFSFLHLPFHRWLSFDCSAFDLHLNWSLICLCLFILTATISVLVLVTSWLDSQKGPLTGLISFYPSCWSLPN